MRPGDDKDTGGPLVEAGRACRGDGPAQGKQPLGSDKGAVLLGWGHLGKASRGTGSGPSHLQAGTATWAARSATPRPVSGTGWRDGPGAAAHQSKP